MPTYDEAAARVTHALSRTSYDIFHSCAARSHTFSHERLRQLCQRKRLPSSAECVRLHWRTTLSHGEPSPLLRALSRRALRPVRRRMRAPRGRLARHARPRLVRPPCIIVSALRHGAHTMRMLRRGWLLRPLPAALHTRCWLCCASRRRQRPPRRPPPKCAWRGAPPPAARSTPAGCRWRTCTAARSSGPRTSASPVRDARAVSCASHAPLSPLEACASAPHSVSLDASYCYALRCAALRCSRRV